jgi:hypothetical protein
MLAKFAHLPAGSYNLTESRVKTLCARYVSPSARTFYDETPRPWATAPLCPKCAAAQLIADTATTEVR